MLCQLDNFQFHSHDTNLEKISESFTYSYDQSQTINAFDAFQATGQYSHTLNLSGVLIQKSNHTLAPLLAIAAKKKAVTLAFDNGIAYSVIILAIDTTQSHFLSNGVYLKRDFEIKLGIIHG